MNDASELISRSATTLPACSSAVKRWANGPEVKRWESTWMPYFALNASSTCCVAVGSMEKYRVPLPSDFAALTSAASSTALTGAGTVDATAGAEVGLGAGGALVDVLGTDPAVPPHAATAASPMALTPASRPRRRNARRLCPSTI